MEEKSWRDAIKQQLGRLNTPLKQATAVAYIGRKIAGRPYDTYDFWARPETCSRSTWNKWKRYDPEFNSVLDAAWAITTEHRNDEATKAIAEAVLTLQINAPAFASEVVDIAINGNAKPETRLRASLAGLDRASAMTAPKSEIEVPGLNDAMERIWGKKDSEDEDGAE